MDGSVGHNYPKHYDRNIQYDLFSTVTAGDQLEFRIASSWGGGVSSSCSELQCKIEYIKSQEWKNTLLFY